jgi:hypothetical protein
MTHPLRARVTEIVGNPDQAEEAIRAIADWLAEAPHVLRKPVSLVAKTSLLSSAETRIAAERLRKLGAALRQELGSA